MRLLGVMTLIAVALFSAACGEDTPSQGTERKTVVIDAPGMFCTNCEGMIQDKLSRMEGVYEVKASFDERQAVCVVAGDLDPTVLVNVLPEEYKASVRGP